MKGASSALGAKTARACDSCLRIRARWFCAADDAFLCHSCDNLVHLANQLASKHQRVRLQSSSSSSSKVNSAVTPNKKVTAQAWHSGFTRKARTPRLNKHSLVQKQQHKNEEEELLFTNSSVFPRVPELGSEEQYLDYENEAEHVLCQVPVFDPFDAELGNIYNEVKDDETMKKDVANEEEEEEGFDLESFSEFLPLDMDLAELAADVESLLDCTEEDQIDANNVGVAGAKGANSLAKTKIKDEELEGWNIIDLESLVEEEDEEKVAEAEAASGGSGSSKEGDKERFLRLNYEEVITAWDNQGSTTPWATENPPDNNNFNFDECCRPHYLGLGGAIHGQCFYGEEEVVGSLIGHPLIGISGDGGREARVSRYREKRRTRLFSKKIRYEVRKLNAEKRPRMKGRFVKRTSFVGMTTAFPT
ncbi:hypothetical protein RIF29_06574 [Crotalaria pallida]|uniref:Uncharacterized protein n=1 Tax=Crotalaria pallida TaxID=3830 RepID=A0AAN9J3C6_CROPI